MTDMHAHSARVLDPAATDRILVTGGAGFLGRVLVAQLMQRTASTVVVFALPHEPVPPEWQVQWGARIEVARGDITQVADVARAMQGCQWCFHLATLVGDAGRDEDHQRVTVGGTANIIGPGSGPWVIDAAQALRQGLPALIGGGHGNAALAGVDNVADFLVHAAMHPQAWGQAFHVHDGLAVTWRAYFSDLARLLGTPPLRSVPRALAYWGAWLSEPLFKRLWPQRRPPVTTEALNLIAWDSRLPLDRAYALGWRPKVDHAAQMARIGAWLVERGPSIKA